MAANVIYYPSIEVSLPLRFSDLLFDFPHMARFQCFSCDTPANYGKIHKNNRVIILVNVPLTKNQKIWKTTFAHGPQYYQSVFTEVMY